MSEDEGPIRIQADLASVWGELDPETRKRVIEMFSDMAFRAIARQSQSLNTSPGSEDSISQLRRVKMK
jgi:hypothetical protein